MNKKIKFVAAAVVSLLVTAGVVFGYYQNELKPISSEPEPIVFRVESGETQGAVLTRLEQEGIIKSSFFGKIYTKLSGQQDVYQGNFNLDKSWSLPQIVQYMSSSSNAAPDVTQVLLVEGSWAKDMAKVIASHTLTSEERFLELWNNVDFIKSLMKKYSVLSEDLLNNQHARVLLEGFLYPDTYTFKVDASEEEITETIIKNSQRYYEEYKELLDKSSFSHYEVMTLASIVEYEANTDEDMRKVAGVFMNRLNTNMMLQSSVTVCYALYEFDSWEDCESSQPNSPYNTYLNPGLTPGPILNPSLRAIKATLDYDPNDYYFFIADVHGDQKVYYQKTYEEHVIVRKRLLGY